MAKKLHTSGYFRVRNLEGSIFQWTNENRPLVHDRKPTARVDPFNDVWKVLLDNSHRLENPPAAVPAHQPRP